VKDFNPSPFKNSIAQLQNLYSTLKAQPILVLIFTNKSQFVDYPNLTSFCMKKDILVQCVVKTLKADNVGVGKFAENMGTMPGVVEQLFEGFMDFDDDTKEDVLI
jgi:hypothetical protein